MDRDQHLKAGRGMDQYIKGDTIRRLREEKGLSEQDLADRLNLDSDLISRWEEGMALPDISLLEPLSKALETSLDRMLDGAEVVRTNRGIDVNESRFYVCPVCGNIVTSAGNAEIRCCNVTLQPQAEQLCDDGHMIEVEESDGEYYVTVEHEMTKSHYISFLAFAGGDGVNLAKMYPEWYCQSRFPIKKGRLYCYCNIHGLFCKDVRPPRHKGMDLSKLGL